MALSGGKLRSKLVMKNTVRVSCLRLRGESRGEGDEGDTYTHFEEERMRWRRKDSSDDDDNDGHDQLNRLCHATPDRAKAEAAVNVVVGDSDSDYRIIERSADLLGW